MLLFVDTKIKIKSELGRNKKIMTCVQNRETGADWDFFVVPIMRKYYCMEKYNTFLNIG